MSFKKYDRNKYITNFVIFLPQTSHYSDSPLTTLIFGFGRKKSWNDRIHFSKFTKITIIKIDIFPDQARTKRYCRSILLKKINTLEWVELWRVYLISHILVFNVRYTFR